MASVLRVARIADVPGVRPHDGLGAFTVVEHGVDRVLHVGSAQVRRAFPVNADGSVETRYSAHGQGGHQRVKVARLISDPQQVVALVLKILQYLSGLILAGVREACATTMAGRSRRPRGAISKQL